MGNADHTGQDSAGALREALAALRATGIHRADRFGHALLDTLNIPDTDSAARTRELVRRSLLSCTDRLNERPRKAFLEAAGFRRDAPQTRGARLQATAELFGVSQRTAYRMVDDAIDALVSMLLSSQERSMLQDVDYVFATARCRIDMSGPKPAVVLERTITARTEGIDHIDERVGFPRLPGESLSLRALEGCCIDDLHFVAPGTWALRLQLPRPLRLGEQHSFAFSVILPDHDSLEPLVGFLPHTATYDAEVELLFGKSRPNALQQFASTPPLEPEAHVPPELWSQPVADRHLFRFAQMQPGLCYGVRWRW